MIIQMIIQVPHANSIQVHRMVDIVKKEDHGRETNMLFLIEHWCTHMLCKVLIIKHLRRYVITVNYQKGLEYDNSPLVLGQ